MAGSPLFIRLILSATASLGLTISEFYMSYYTHSLSLLVVANQSFYNLLSLATGASSIAVNFVFILYHPKRIKVVVDKKKTYIITCFNNTYIIKAFFTKNKPPN